MPLFDNADPAVAEQQARQAGRLQDLATARLPAGRGMVASASQAGRGVGGLFGGEDPAVKKAKSMQNAMNETNMKAKSRGITLQSDPIAYYDLSIESMQRHGLSQEAAKATKEKESYKRYKTRKGPGGSLIETERTTGKSKAVLGYDPARTARERAKGIKTNKYPTRTQQKDALEMIDRDDATKGLSKGDKEQMAVAVGSRTLQILKDNPNLNADEAREQAFTDVMSQVKPGEDVPWWFDKPPTFTAKREQKSNAAWVQRAMKANPGMTRKQVIAEGRRSGKIR